MIEKVVFFDSKFTSFLSLGGRGSENDPSIVGSAGPLSPILLRKKFSQNGL